MPKTIEEALKLDRINGESIDKEMRSLKVAFDILPEGSKPPPGYKPSSGHLVFDVRMTLERKARWVKNGHKSPQRVKRECAYYFYLRGIE